MKAKRGHEDMPSKWLWRALTLLIGVFAIPFAVYLDKDGGDRCRQVLMTLMALFIFAVVLAILGY